VRSSGYKGRRKVSVQYLGEIATQVQAQQWREEKYRRGGSRSRGCGGGCGGSDGGAGAITCGAFSFTTNLRARADWDPRRAAAGGALEPGATQGITPRDTPGLPGSPMQSSIALQASALGVDSSFCSL